MLKVSQKQRMVMVEVISALLILLFLYATVSKLLSPAAARHDMLNQPFPRWFSGILVWLVPSLELLLVGLLVSPRSRCLGLWGCFGLLSLFTVYAGLILLEVFPYVPCGCGGVIRYLSWPQHLLFNLFFAGIAGYAISLRGQLKKTNSFNF